MKELAALSAADLQALRLATQVFRHKAALEQRPRVERYWADLGVAVDFALARRGIGFVVGDPPQLGLDEAADETDHRLLNEHLALLAGNEQLSRPIRDVCAALRQRVTA